MAEIKVALVFDPLELKRGGEPIGVMHVTKKGKLAQFEHFRLTIHQVRKYGFDLNKEMKEVLLPFCDEKIAEARQALNEKAKGQRAGISKDVFLQQSMTRHNHFSFEKLKPFAGLFKWYNKSDAGGNRISFTPCVFSNFKPLLHFKVIAKNRKLQLLTSVKINEGNYPLGHFNREAFFLYQGNEFFMLSYKDYQTLEWLDAGNILQYAGDPLGFSQNVLQRLEADYQVDRNNLFTKKEIRVVPEKRVLLSELSNSFLMLTPQWLYDGFVIDGAWNETYETVVDGEEYIVYRDKQEEQKLVDVLRGFHDKFSSQRNGYFYLPFAEAQKKQWFLKVFHSMLDNGIELTGMDLLQHFRYSPHKAETTTNIVGEHGNLVTIDINVQFGSEKVNLGSLQKMLLAGQKAILLKDNSLGILADEWIQKYATVIKHGKVGKGQVEVPKYLAISEQQRPGDGGVMSSLVKEQWWQKWSAWQNGDGEVYSKPANLKATLRPYQQKGFEWLSLLAEAGAGGCLADDMGLGKTLQSICFVTSQLEKHPEAVNIIVCPSSLIYNWQQEFEKFASSVTSVVYHGATRKSIDLQQHYQVIITSYGTLRADAGQLLSKYYHVAIIDESHNIKNPSAQITGAVSMVQAAIRVALSGTPVVNNTFDLYSQLNFALPGLFGSREFFRKEYADAIDRNHDEEKIKALQKLTAPFILRRTKEQVATDLPEKNEMILWCKMGTEQHQLYNDIRDQIRGSLFLDIKTNGFEKSKFGVLQGMLKLRQICNSPLLLPADEQLNCTHSVKTEVMVQELKNIIGNHKALVFSQFSSMLHLLAAELEKHDISFYHFDGSTPAAKRSEMVNAFQDESDNTNVFLISLKAGNTGLTLTAADYVFLFDPWWNTAVERQAIDRTHRIGQTKNVFAYKLICENTIEEKIIQLQQRKQKIAGELVSNDDGFIRSLTEEDVQYLFS